MPTKRGTTWQGVVYHATLPSGRARRTFPTRGEAQAWELDSKARLIRGEAIDLGEAARRADGLPYTLQELRDHTFRVHWSSMAGAKTADINSTAITKAIGPSMPIAKIGRVEIDKARAKLLAAGNHTTTINKKVSCLSTMLETARALGIIPAKPEFPKPYREVEGKISRFTPEQEVAALAFFERIGNQDMADYVMLSVDTGLRQGECLRVRHEDVTGTSVTCWGHWTKNGRTRTVPLSQRCRDMIHRRFLAAGDRPDLLRVELFCGLTKDSLTHHWTRMRAELNLLDDPDFTPHLMRHEFCSRLADRGMNAPTIMALAGHSSLTTTQRYIRVSGKVLEAAMAGMNEPVTPAVDQVQAIIATLARLGLLKEGADLKFLTEQGLLTHA